MRLADNVNNFLTVASDHHGRRCADYINQDLYNQICEQGMSSPIEQLFFIAAHVLCEAEYEKLNPDPIYNREGKEILGRGIYLDYQRKAGKYSIDFVLQTIDFGPDGVYTPVAVELDGHDFHDRDKNQRSYEKARDRFLTKSGYRVLHYTGSDVVKDPFRVAFEALEMVGLYAGSGRLLENYNKNDPLGLEL